MTPEQLAAVKVGDVVQHASTVKGRVSQTTPQWFMVTWEDGDTPRIYYRASAVAHALRYNAQDS